MITKEQIAEMERTAEKELGEGYVCMAISNKRLIALCTLARAALDEIEHHELQMRGAEICLADATHEDDSDLKPFYEDQINYHRARLEKLKGE